MSPRRSSRARTTQPTPSVPQHSNSFSSSIKSGRASRSAGPDQKPSSQRSSIVARSQSSEDRDASAKASARRTRSSQEDVNAESTNAVTDDVDDEGEEEVTRCICGNQEYPGLPVSAGDSSKGSSKGDPDPAAFAEDATGWFIQCDGCKVWQHGGCVGIMDEATSPEEYFCEQCRKDLHQITTTANERKYSLYLPVQGSKSAQSPPLPAPKKHSKRSKDSSKAARLNAEGISKGRRSTLNSRESRDAALEEAQLQIAIEESKRDGGTASTATDVRKGKRSRSASEEHNEDTKRQRTTPSSASSASRSKSRRQNSNSADETEKPERAKNIRGAAARNHRLKEVSDDEAQREKERADAGRRNGCTEQDNESGSVSPEPLPRTVSARGNKPPTTFFPIPTLPEPPPPKTSHKKTGRPPARRGRVGRNQYTKDRDLPHRNDAHRKSTPAPSNSSQNADGGTPGANGITNGHVESNALGKPSKPRHMNPNKTTMNDMKRRVANILEFISITQVQMAGATAASTTKSSTSTNTPPDSNSDTRNGDQKGEISEGSVSTALSDLNGIDERAFGALNSLEMMDVLTRQLLKWQGEYGKWDK